MSVPPLFIAENQVRSLLNMADALAALEDFFALPCGEKPQDKANLPRQRALLPDGFFNVMAAKAPARDVFGLKAYYRSGGNGGYHVLLYSVERGDLLAVIEANYMSQLRTGAASGLAAKYMARQDATEMALIGTGKQAFWQVAAVAGVRQLNSVRIFGRTSARAVELAERVQAELGVAAMAVSTAREAVESADIVATITTSATPVCQSGWVQAGTHINAAGANTSARQELETGLVQRAATLATDDVEQARMEAAEFLAVDRQGAMNWASVLTLDELCAGKPGRQSQQDISIFKSLGVAMEDVALASVLYQRALANT
ncbi:ornithine cyclodeaminase family protein [Aureimonas fodinaquatilis]|uniref:Ornithine cyclodeaminase family protein n=1 Tax=Aureimonas fodinaquatilis TaxID=2565783 RepID=A0A5B0DYY7_9HYPH|nr:ornithine cyclodeaminase family protein [Aureimonas fodinaquatilis]KAA0970399.1 ornithine cyclodeaminase family protein [Aureimonas fodinaquatilis]